MRTPLAPALALAVALAALPARAAPPLTSAEQEHFRLACIKNLESLRIPIRRFVQKKGVLPYWLSDLRTAGLVADTTAFICPLTRATGALPRLDLYFPDPEIPRSYLYEWNPTPLVPGAAAGEVVTMRAWKERQRALVGGRVPLVRCVLHEKVLNLGVDGDLFESDLVWETSVPDTALRPQLGIPMPPAPGPVERLRRAEQWVGLPAPDFTLPDLQGRAVTLSEHRGRDVVVLDFWATWCGPCVQLFPQVKALEAEFAGKPVAFYAVNLAESPETVQRFLTERNLDLRVLLESDGKTAAAYEITGIPRTVIVGKDGLVKGVRVGYAMDYAETTRRDLENALKAD